jgi:hypothetical protein
MNNKDDGDDDDDDGVIKELPQDLVQCPACLRRMRSEIFSKHPNICRENPANKRHTRVFDMSKYRSIRSGDKIIPVRKVSPPNANKSNINQRPSQTRSAKRDRRSDAVVPPIINNFCTYKRNFIQSNSLFFISACPNCKRTFCEKAYDRHVKFCSSKLKQLQQPPSEETLLARIKLDRRIKFNSNRTPSTFSNTAPISTPSIDKSKPSLPTEAFCFLSLRKKSSESLARCPWCRKPYLPNCIHYCRNPKELFSIQSK